MPELTFYSVIEDNLYVHSQETVDLLHGIVMEQSLLLHARQESGRSRAVSTSGTGRGSGRRTGVG